VTDIFSLNWKNKKPIEMKLFDNNKKQLHGRKKHQGCQIFHGTK
jgi:hypothetical protein